MNQLVTEQFQLFKECGLFGKSLEDMPETTEEEIAYKQQVMKEGDYIPEIIAQAMKDNKMWYKLKFNGELEKLSNAEIYEAIGQFLQYFQALLQIKPELVNAINDYEFLDLLKSVSNLVNDKLIKSKYKYEEVINQIQEMQQQQAEAQALLQQSQVAKNMASAGKDGATANAMQ